MKIIISMLISLTLIFACLDQDDKFMKLQQKNNHEVATLAGGCFWCLEAPFESIDGINKVISGYSGGEKENPTYNEVCSGKTGYKEAVQVHFNPAVISYSEILDIFWKQFDPTDEGGSFNDRGSQYESAIFYHNESQKMIAKRSKMDLDKSGIFNKSFVTEITEFTSFYPAEEYHQDYAQKNSTHYYRYRKGSGRDAFIKGLWGDDNVDKYQNNADDKKVKMNLTEIQYNVTQKNATERPFDNEYWDNDKPGIYVDIVSGEPLFSSKDQFPCGSGWPSFSKPIDTRYVKKKSDVSHGMTRVEIRSKLGDSHLGHVFDDGPESTNLRYCINSASLKFIPKDKMKELGYGEYLWLVELK